MLVITRSQELLTDAALMTGVQLAVAAAFWRVLRRPSAPGPAPAGRVAVVVPCKGPLPGLAEGARALLSQDHADYEALFLVPDASDPACAELSRVIAAEGRGRILVSRARPPSSCSGKIADLLYALDHLPEDCRYVAFADADLRVRPDWLSSLLAPLADPAVTTTTSCALYVAADAGFWSFLRMCWFGLIIPPYGTPLGFVCGQSYALRRPDVERLNLREVWSRAFLEDMALAIAVRRAGGKIRFVPEALSVCEDSCDARQFSAILNKWVLCCRFYAPAAWVAAGIALFMHGYVAFWALHRPATPWIPALLLAGDGLALGAQLQAYARAAPRLLSGLHPRWRPVWLWGFLAAPALWLSFLVQFANSILSNRVRWGGRVYRLRGWQRVEVVG